MVTYSEGRLQTPPLFKTYALMKKMSIIIFLLTFIRGTLRPLEEN